MSKAQVEKFVSFVSNRPAVLQEAAKGATDQDAVIGNIVEYARDHGYDFSREEAMAWVTGQAALRESGELNDLQLEAVAGGKVDCGTETEIRATIAAHNYPKTESKPDPAPTPAFDMPPMPGLLGDPSKK